MNRRKRLPPWLKVPFPAGSDYARVEGLLRMSELHTVCEEARCPNIGECFASGTATFLILGDICTRNCSFCAITSGRPAPPDPEEPERVARTVARLGLSYAVVTSVTRDDLPDGGASLFAETIHRIREDAPQCQVEVLIPDFGGSGAALDAIIAARPDVLNHNLETVARLYPTVRPQAAYGRSLELLRQAKDGGLATKSGLMVGLGETEAELHQAMADLREAGCDLLTLGQYLRPSQAHLPVARFYAPEEFEALREMGMRLGFRWVEAGPLVRSSYRAHRQAQAL